MTEMTSFEWIKSVDLSSHILHQENAPAFPQEIAKDAYYGYYLLAKSAGKLIESIKHVGKTNKQYGDDSLCTLALSYLESDRSLSGKCPFVSRKPFSYQLVNILFDYVRFMHSHENIHDNQYYIDQINAIIRQIEESRISENIMRSTDIYLAKQWCRVLRVFVFLRIPLDNLPRNYRFDRDLKIAQKRGINQLEIARIDFLVRYRKLLQEKKIGRVILLAEEWEVFCTEKGNQAEAFEYEELVLSVLDTDENFRIGLEWVDMLILRHNDNHKFKLYKARFLRRDGNLSAAVALCDLILSEHELDYEAHCLKSNLHFLMENYSQAVLSGLMAVSCGEEHSLTHLALAYALLYDGQYEDAISSFNQALEIEQTVEGYRGKSKALIMQNKTLDALQCLISVSRLAPDDAEIFHDLADVYFMCGYLDECRQYCKKCLSIDPQSAGAYVLLGMLEIRENADENAKKWLSRALEIEPLNPIALNELAYVQHMAGNDDECLRLLQRALEIAPDFSDALCSLGVVYYYQSNFEQSLSYFEKTLDIEPEHTGALVGKGNLYLAQSELEDAVIWYDKALAIDPYYSEAVHGKANAYRAMGLEQEAFDWMQKATDLDGDQEN